MADGSPAASSTAIEAARRLRVVVTARDRREVRRPNRELEVHLAAVRRLGDLRCDLGSGSERLATCSRSRRPTSARRGRGDRSPHRIEGEPTQPGVGAAILIFASGRRRRDRAAPPPPPRAARLVAARGSASYMAFRVRSSQNWCRVALLPASMMPTTVARSSASMQARGRQAGEPLDDPVSKSRPSTAAASSTERA